MTDRARNLPRLKDTAGVTLVELMIVLVMIAVGILALSAVQTRSSTDVYATGRATRAVEVAQSRMETTRGAGYALAVSDSGVADGVFNWRTDVSAVSSDLKRIDVTVSWTEQNQARSIQLNNLISNR